MAGPRSGARSNMQKTRGKKRCCTTVLAPTSALALVPGSRPSSARFPRESRNHHQRQTKSRNSGAHPSHACAPAFLWMFGVPTLKTSRRPASMEQPATPNSYSSATALHKPFDRPPCRVSRRRPEVGMPMNTFSNVECNSKICRQKMQGLRIHPDLHPRGQENTAAGDPICRRLEEPTTTPMLPTAGRACGPQRNTHMLCTRASR